MKKQILIVSVFIVAILANVNNAFGQLSTGITSTQPIDPLSCIAGSEPLHPFPGVPYIYSLDGSAGEETAKNYTWWATKDQNFVTGPGATNIATMLTSPDVTGTSATYGATTDAATAGANEVTITWSSSILAGTDYQGLPGPGTPTFVVGYSEGLNCADNIQVYEINPSPNFTIDIAAIDTVTSNTLPWDDASLGYCVDDVQSATYNTGTYELDMDYGHNVIYYEVAASNFVNDWTPQFQIISGLRSDQTAVISMFPTLADAQAGTNQLWASGSLAVGDMGTTVTTSTALTASDPLEISAGVSVFVKVYIDNNTEESLTSNPFVLAVDAIDDGGSGIWDMEDADCAALDDNPDQVDQATITVTPRPQLDHNTTDSGAPDPTNVVPKDGGTNYIHY